MPGGRVRKPMSCCLSEILGNESSRETKEISMGFFTSQFFFSEQAKAVMRSNIRQFFITTKLEQFPLRRSFWAQHVDSSRQHFHRSRQSSLEFAVGFDQGVALQMTAAGLMATHQRACGFFSFYQLEKFLHKLKNGKRAGYINRENAVVNFIIGRNVEIAGHCFCVGNCRQTKRRIPFPFPVGDENSFWFLRKKYFQNGFEIGDSRPP